MSVQSEMTASADLVPVDLAHLRRFTFGDAALEREVLMLFADQLPETLEALKAAATDRDWKMAAHTLKGSARAVGAWRMARLAEAAEGLVARDGEPAARLAAVAGLEDAAFEAQAFITQIAGQPKAG